MFQIAQAELTKSIDSKVEEYLQSFYFIRKEQWSYAFRPPEARHATTNNLVERMVRLN